MQKGWWGKKNSEKKVTENKMHEAVVVKNSKGTDVHVPMVKGFDLSKLQCLIDVHVHFHAK